MTEQKMKSGHGKKIKQRMKPYIVLQYLPKIPTKVRVDLIKKKNNDQSLTVICYCFLLFSV